MERTLYERLVLRLFYGMGDVFGHPVPFPRWRESARGRMLMCLPLIGLVEGGLWALLVWLLAKLCLPEALGALCAAAFPWLVTGFLHLDGYMDVCDAVLSRRDLATRQKILKDSHCGAFAVIAMVLLALTQWIVCQSVSLNEIPLLPLAALPCAVRLRRRSPCRTSARCPPANMPRSQSRPSDIPPHSY